jgi:hypothetical protein
MWGRVVSTPGPASYAAFVLGRLPRELTLTADTVMKLSEADAALGRLAGSGRPSSATFRPMTTNGLLMLLFGTSRTAGLRASATGVPSRHALGVSTGV